LCDCPEKKPFRSNFWCENWSAIAVSFEQTQTESSDSVYARTQPLCVVMMTVATEWIVEGLGI
jgi:hypothetical protein